MDQIQFWIRQQTKQLEADCFGRRSQIERSRSMQQVVRAADVHIKAELRGDPGVKRAVADIKSLAEKKLSVMLDEQIKVLGAIDTEGELKAEYGKLMTQEWRILSGNFPSVFRRAQDSIHMLKHKLAQAALPKSTEDYSPG